MANTELKLCWQCNQEKPYSEYHKKKFNKDGHNNRCKACIKVANKLNWAQYYSVPENKAKSAKRGHKQIRKIRDYIKKQKDVPCADCKLSFHWSVMHFDHIDPTNKEIGVSRISTKNRLKEIEKCEVVCTNCHAKRTHARRGCSDCDKNCVFLNLKTVARLEKYVRNLKHLKPCNICKISYPYYVMHFDHIHGTKLFTLNKTEMSGKTEEEINAELSKCQLLCGNCHFYKSWKEGYNNPKHPNFKGGAS